MSSQDSEGESYVADYLADPKVYGGVERYGWTTEEEEDYEPKGREERSSEEEEVPLPQPGDMHENKQELCKKILSLEQEIEDLRDQNSVLKRKLRKKPMPSPKPTPSSPTKKN